MVSYPQMPALLDSEQVDLLSQPLVARISTHNPDGTIHTVPIWFLYEDDTILFGTQDITQKVKNVRADPTMTVVVDQTEAPFKGIIMYGKASLEYDDVIEKRIKIFAKYMPIEQAKGFAHGLADKWEGVVIRFRPDKIISYDYGKGSLI